MMSLLNEKQISECLVNKTLSLVFHSALTSFVCELPQHVCFLENVNSCWWYKRTCFHFSVLVSIMSSVYDFTLAKGFGCKIDAELLADLHQNINEINCGSC